ncbi:MAG TPA: phosphoenolpyruvate--protein phosphotransferase [Syntrophales bacterium]|jgi:phosphotransferase system enzyme I (PtsI)|nr:phosphoenolpyruvate--protein phosphotransferase [Syntrophales bacterium]HRT62716.1 phosphoenolpyruvate--protein phosphotransferase [Syntrophales bacterium]
MKDRDVRETIALKGTAVSPGIVIGRAHVLHHHEAPIPRRSLDKKNLIAAEIQRFRKALKESEKQLLAIKKKLRDQEGIEPLYIIDVHIMILNDRMLINRTVANIEEGVNAEWALRKTLDKYKEVFSKVDDDYLRERMTDVEYVGQRILRNLVGEQGEAISGAGENVIIVARDLSPADTMQIKVEKILGFATDIGGKTSHTAIVARSYEIPAVVGLQKITSEVRTNDRVIIDGTAGVVIVNPDPEVVRRYEDKMRHYKVMEDDLLRYAGRPAVTADGHRVRIGVNIEFMEEVPSAITHGAEGIGLYRTEFIYINKERLPTEEEHFENYRTIVGARGLKWSTIRTFDLGGDKFISDPKVAKEMNPVMGLRAIRFCLKEVELFKVQLRAILRASALGRVKILFPMISGIEEIREAKRIFYEVKRELQSREVPFDPEIKLGIMVEVPSAVVVADSLAREVDFFSIGTNDLIQYTLAIDRVNERVSYLYEPLHPAVLRLIKRVVDAGHHAGIEVAMCGEMAGEPLYTMVLLGLELDELSMNALVIPRVKKIIQEVNMKECRALLKKVLTMSTAAEIEYFVRSYMVKKFPDAFAEETP